MGLGVLRELPVFLAPIPYGTSETGVPVRRMRLRAGTVAKKMYGADESFERFIAIFLRVEG